MEIEWIDGFEIKAVAKSGEIVISANREGLLSLAKHLTALADGASGDHIHYDEHNSLEEGSAELIIEKGLPEDIWIYGEKCTWFCLEEDGKKRYQPWEEVLPGIGEAVFGVGKDKRKKHKRR